MIEFLLNGRPTRIEVDPRTPLLRVLRDDLDLTGTKQGCDMEGECGACTVLVDGQAVRSCLLPVAKVAGRSVTTVEGLGTPERPHPLQVAFLETGAVQCGYCTPGMLLAACALLNRNPRPNREEILSALDGNICRCTGYVKIVEAVERAAGRRAAENEPDPGPAIGGDLARHRGWERVTGVTRFVEDLKVPDLHYVHVVRSPHFHARVVAVDSEPALAVCGVVRVLTAADMPGENGLGGYSIGEHLLAAPGDTVRMLGDPVALVIGTTPDAAAAGGRAVRITYAELPHSLDVVHALEPGAICIHPDGNLLSADEIQTGNADAALVGSEVVVESTYQTQFQAHMALEREAVLGYVDEAGRLAVMGGNHQPHWARGYLSRILGLPEEEIRVITPPTGGSFGGKQDIWPLAATALALYHLRRPVRLAYTRREVMEATPKRHPYTCRCTAGATPDGELTGLRFDARLNTGAYDSAGRFLADYAVTTCIGPYRWRGVDARAAVVYSNGPKAGQMRGFGTPQPAFAMECTLDELAQKLEIDPLQLRVRNALADDEVTGLGYPLGEPLGFRATLEAIAPDYAAAVARTAAFNADSAPGRLRRGVGLAGMWYRFGKYGRPLSQAEAAVGLDGRITVYCSSSDYGQGVETVFTQLAAETLGVPRSAFELVNADTARTLDGDVTGASRSTYWVGGAVVDAARRLRAALLSTAAELLDRPPDELILTGEDVRAQAGDGARVSLAGVAAEMERTGQPRCVRGRQDLSHIFPAASPSSYLPMFVTGVQVAEVELDLDTGQARVLRISAAHDVGRAINPRDAAGQIEGGIVMALGAVLMEEFIPGMSTGFSTYLVPTARSVPEIHVHLVEVTSRYGPLGAKGLGEAVLLPTAPAIVNAISRAAGVRIRSLPATAERIREAMRGNK